MFQTILNRKHVRQMLVNEPCMWTINDVPINWELMNMTDLTDPLTKENMQWISDRRLMGWRTVGTQLEWITQQVWIAGTSRDPSVCSLIHATDQFVHSDPFVQQWHNCVINSRWMGITIELEDGQHLQSVAAREVIPCVLSEVWWNQRWGHFSF
jgi:hypothetical protein